MTKNKDKTLTFSHYKAFTFNPQKTSDKEAKKSLANQLWDKGYVPLDITIDGYSSYRRLVSCVCAYAGKKQARKIGAFKKIFKENEPYTINFKTGKETGVEIIKEQL